MQNEMYIIFILAVWCISSTAMCVRMINDISDKQNAIDKSNMERDFYKAKCENLKSNIEE